MRLEWRQAMTSRFFGTRFFGTESFGMAHVGRVVDQPVLPRRDGLGHRPERSQEPEKRESFGTNGNGSSEERPACREPVLERFGGREAERSSDLGQQREPKPKGGSGRSRLRRRTPATDSNAEQGLEVEGDDGKLRARRSVAEPSGEVERATGWSGESHRLNGEKERAGASWREVEESFRGHTRQGHSETPATAASEGKPS